MERITNNTRLLKRKIHLYIYNTHKTHTGNSNLTFWFPSKQRCKISETIFLFQDFSHRPYVLFVILQMLYHCWVIRLLMDNNLCTIWNFKNCIRTSPHHISIIWTFAIITMGCTIYDLEVADFSLNINIIYKPKFIYTYLIKKKKKLLNNTLWKDTDQIVYTYSFNQSNFKIYLHIIYRREIISRLL